MKTFPRGHCSIDNPGRSRTLQLGLPRRRPITLRLLFSLLAPRHTYEHAPADGVAWLRVQPSSSHPHARHRSLNKGSPPNTEQARSSSDTDDCCACSSAFSVEHSCQHERRSAVLRSLSRHSLTDCTASANTDLLAGPTSTKNQKEPPVGSRVTQHLHERAFGIPRSGIITASSRQTSSTHPRNRETVTPLTRRL